MKRRTVDFDNSVDGKELKKIKKLTFQLADDDNEKLESAKPINVIRNVNINSDDESENSESENELCESHDDSETMNADDLSALNKFLNPSMAKDVIEGMADAKKEVAENLGIDEIEELDYNDYKEHFDTLKQLLVNYKKGRVFPKTVKVLPQIKEWYNLMDQLDFPSWSASAVQLITEQFTAKGGEGVEIYYENFLLPYLRANIAEKRRLDNVLYKTLQGALFRRREFMTCLLLPWCKPGLTQLEATILANVLKGSTVKVDVAAPAMTIIASNRTFSMEIVVVLRAMLEKQYNLPYETISTFVDYFAHFLTETARMPLVWFQALHCFVGLYHPHIGWAGARRLLHLCQVHVHDKITDATKAYLRMVPKEVAATDNATDAVEME